MYKPSEFQVSQTSKMLPLLAQFLLLLLHAAELVSAVCPD
jgi:hypothetical protein